MERGERGVARDEEDRRRRMRRKGERGSCIRSGRGEEGKMIGASGVGPRRAAQAGNQTTPDVE